MKFNDILLEIEEELEENRGILNNDEKRLLYSVVIYRILNMKNLKDEFFDVFINTDADPYMSFNNLYSVKLLENSNYSIFTKNEKKKFFTKMLLNEDKEFINNFKDKLKNSKNMKDLSLNYNFEELSKLKLLLNLKNEEFATLLNYIDYQEDNKFGKYKEKRNFKNNNFKNFDNYSTSYTIISSLSEIKIQEDNPITIDNIDFKLERSEYKKILELSGFNSVDFSIENFKEYLKYIIDEDFMQDNPLGILLDSKSKSEFLSRIFELYHFEDFKNNYLNIVNLQLNQESLEEYLNNNKIFDSMVSNILLKIDNKFPELNYSVENIQFLKYEDLTEKNPLFLIDKFEMFDNTSVIYNDLSSYISYFKYPSKQEFKKLYEPILNDSFVKEESLILTIDNNFVSKGIFELLKIKYKESSEIEFSNVMLSEDLSESQLNKMISKVFELAEKENLIVQVQLKDNISLQKNQKFIEAYEKVRKENPNVVSESYTNPFNSINSLLGSKGLSYKDNLYIQKELTLKLEKLIVKLKNEGELLSDFDFETYTENSFKSLKNNLKLNMKL